MPWYWPFKKRKPKTPEADTPLETLTPDGLGEERDIPVFKSRRSGKPEQAALAAQPRPSGNATPRGSHHQTSRPAQDDVGMTMVMLGGSGSHHRHDTAPRDSDRGGRDNDSRDHSSDTSAGDSGGGDGGGGGGE